MTKGREKHKRPRSSGLGCLFRLVSAIFIVLVTTKTVMAPQWQPGLSSERDYQEQLGVELGAKVEVANWDRTRTDLLHPQWAGEIDFGPKWAEGIGQALYYGIVHDRRPHLILLIKNGQERYAHRAQAVAAKYNIQLTVRHIP